MSEKLAYVFRHVGYWIRNKIGTLLIKYVAVPNILGSNVRIDSLRLVKHGHPHVKAFNVRNTRQVFLVKSLRNKGELSRELKGSIILSKLEHVNKPKLVGHHKHFIIHEFIEGISLRDFIREETNETVDNVVIKVLKDLHSVHQSLARVDGVELSYANGKDTIANLLDSFIKNLSAINIDMTEVSLREWHSALSKIDRDSIVNDCSVDRENSVLIHGDFKTSNIVVVDRHIPFIIDWEYVSKGSIWYDLACFMKEMDVSKREKYLAAYMENGLPGSDEKGSSWGDAKRKLSNGIIFRLLQDSSDIVGKLRRTKRHHHIEGLNDHVKSLIQEVNNW